MPKRTSPIINFKSVLLLVIAVFFISAVTIIFAHKKPPAPKPATTKIVAKSRQKTTQKTLKSAVRWSNANARQAVHNLARKIGVRTAGSSREHKAARYIEKRLKDLGYKPKKQAFRITGGRKSYNVVAKKMGRNRKKQFIIGAHYDSKRLSPGANDNGSGVATLLELARVLKKKSPHYNVVFVFFGAEEKVGTNPNNHHFGSRYYAKKMSLKAKKKTKGMISVDMAGYGKTFHVGSMKKGTMRLVNSLRKFGKRKKIRLTYLKDPGRTGWSDHEAFENAGIPAAWLEWRNDPTYHSARDNFSHIQWSRITTTGKFLYGYLR